MLNEREMTVLRELRRDARKQFTQISEDTNIPVTTVFDYYQKLKKVIEKEVALPDFSKLGYYVKAILVAKGAKLLRYLEHEPRTNSLYDFGKGEFFAELVLESDRDFDQLKETAEAFEPESFKAWKVKEELRREAFLP